MICRGINVSPARQKHPLAVFENIGKVFQRNRKRQNDRNSTGCGDGVQVRIHDSFRLPVVVWVLLIRCGVCRDADEWLVHKLSTVSQYTPQHIAEQVGPRYRRTFPNLPTRYRIGTLQPINITRIHHAVFLTLLAFTMLVPVSAHAHTPAQAAAISTVQGTVKTLKAKSITMKVGMATYTVTVRSSTKYRDKNQKAIAYSGIQVGHTVRVQGVKNVAKKTVISVTLVTDLSLPKASTPTGSASVNITNFAFNPAPLSVKRGTTVMWTNNDTTSHTVTGGVGGPGSTTINHGGTYHYTFTTTGIFPYHCGFHPSMTASVVVTE